MKVKKKIKWMHGAVTKKKIKSIKWMYGDRDCPSCRELDKSLAKIKGA
jgi:IS1 family transposase